MTDDRKYVRVYYNDLIRDYPGVWGDDAQLATWLRLLATADPMWPTPPELPRSVKPRVLSKLVDTTLVSTVDAHRFRMKGMDAERARRSDAGRNAAAMRWHSDRTPAPDATAMPKRAETSRDETSKDEADAPPLTLAIDYIEQRSGRSWHSRPGSRLYDTLAADIQDFGDRWHLAAKAVSGERPDHGQLIFGASNRLHPIDKGAPIKAPGGHTRPEEEVNRAFDNG